MAPARIAPADLADWLPAGGRVLVTGATGESLILAEAVMDAGEALGPMTFTGIFIPGVNNHDYLANADCRVETYFVRSEEHTSELQSLMRISYAVFCLKKKTTDSKHSTQ